MGSKSEHRVWLAAHVDEGTKRGMVLSLESTCPSKQSLCKLEDADLVVQVGDESKWHFAKIAGTWQRGTLYRVRVSCKAFERPNVSVDVLGETRVHRSLDARFAPAPADEPIVLLTQPKWADAPADARVIISSATLEFKVDGDSETVLSDLLVAQPRAIVVSDSPQGRLLSLIVDLRFKIVPLASATVPPLIDAYGQWKAGSWAGKIRNQADLRRVVSDELASARQVRVRQNTDKWGGYRENAFHESSTGFYHVAQRPNGVWWLVTPEGNPCFYVGVSGVPGLLWPMTPVRRREFLWDTLPARSGEFAQVWAKSIWGEASVVNYVSWHAANLIRSVGPTWRQHSVQQASRRLKLWGFSGAGKWSDPLPPTLPRFPSLNRNGVPTATPGGRPDAFDPEVVKRLRDVVKNQVKPHKHDMSVVAWSLGNEDDEIVTSEEVRQVLMRQNPLILKQKLISYLCNRNYHGDLLKAARDWNIPVRTAMGKSTILEQISRSSITNVTSEAVEDARLYWADKYYQETYAAVKDAAPHHLYAGFWVLVKPELSTRDVAVLAKYTDVLGFDQYSWRFRTSSLDRLLSVTNLPIICGEFSFPPHYEGQRGFGCFSVWAKDDEEAGMRYRHWLYEAADTKQCVGALWFSYRDQPPTGRGPATSQAQVVGENYAFGLVDVADRTKHDIVKHVCSANARVQQWHTVAKR